jgi:hypothetical protein
MDDQTPTTGADDGSAPQPAAQQPVPVPSRRWTGVLAAAMLGIGVAVGAAIGPAPSQSFGLGAPLAGLLKALLASHSPAAAAKSSHAATGGGAEPVTAAASQGAGASEAASAPEETAPTETEKETGGKGGGKEETATKAQPFYRVWVIHLSGAGFSEALGSPAAPYLNRTAVPKGSLLAGWSAIAGQNFASDVAQIAGARETQVENVVQPTCSATGAQECLAAADAFLKSSTEAIQHTLLYKNGEGLIVVQFGKVEDETSTAYQWAHGSVSSTLSTKPPSGVLLLSPRVAAGKKPTVAFEPTAPEKAMQSLLGWKPAKQTPDSSAKTQFSAFERVWLVQLSSEGPNGFAEATKNPAAAPYINQQISTSGSLLSGWNAIAGQNFAADVAQIAGSSETQLVNVIEPPCTAGQQCLAKADAFLKSASETIEGSSAYSGDAGLIVATFGSIEDGAAQEYAAGSITSRLLTEPASGVLLISKRLTEPGKTPKTNFDPASPERSMEALLRR